MKTLAILSQKGGTGKTMLAVNLAIAAAQEDLSTLIIDIDPQASSAKWSMDRPKDQRLATTEHGSMLKHKLIEWREKGVDFIIIDTAPHSENSALQAAKEADLILIPCRPCVADLRAIENTISIAEMAKKPFTIVLNQLISGSKLSRETKSIMDSFMDFITPINIYNRVAFPNAFGGGNGVLEVAPATKAAEEIKALYSYIDRQLKKGK